MIPQEVLLSADNLGRHLAGHWLWRGVSFELWPGQCLALVAPSGAGKTLLMRTLALLDPLQEGQIYFQSKTLAEWSLPHYRSQVIYLPQRAISFEGTVQENLMQAFQLSIHRHRLFARERIDAWLAELGRSPQFLNLKGTELSGGETQLLALLRALQLDPQILLLDEPTASLDAETTARVEQLLCGWLTQPGKACLLTSHDVAQRQRLTHRQIQLQDRLHG